MSWLVQHSNTHMPDGAGTHEATGEGVAVTKLVTALPRGGSVTVQFNPWLGLGIGIGLVFGLGLALGLGLGLALGLGLG